MNLINNIDLELFPIILTDQFVLRFQIVLKELNSKKIESLSNNIKSTWKLSITILGKSQKSNIKISIQFGESLIRNESDVSHPSNSFRFFDSSTA